MTNCFLTFCKGPFGLCEEMKWNEMSGFQRKTKKKIESKVCQCQPQKDQLKFIELFPSFCWNKTDAEYLKGLICYLLNKINIIIFLLFYYKIKQVSVNLHLNGCFVYFLTQLSEREKSRVDWRVIWRGEKVDYKSQK